MPRWPYSSRSFAFATPLFVPWVLFGSPASQPRRPALIVASQGCPPLQTAPARSTSYASLRATHQAPHTRVLHALHIRCRKQQRVRMRRTTKPASRARVVSMLHGGLISVDRHAAAASACRSYAYMPRVVSREYSSGESTQTRNPIPRTLCTTPYRNTTASRSLYCLTGGAHQNL